MQVGRFVGAIGVGLRHDTVTIGVGFRVVGQGTPDLALAARVLRGVARHARYNFASSGPLLLSVQDQAKARVPGLLETAYLEIADPRFRLDELTVLWVSRGDAVTLDPVLCPSRSVAWVAVSRSAAVCGPAITIVPTPAGAAAAPRS